METNNEKIKIYKTNSNEEIEYIPGEQIVSYKFCDNNNNGFKIVKLNVDENMSIAEKYNIMSIPALFVFDKGEVVNKSIGLISKNEVLDLLK